MSRTSRPRAAVAAGLTLGATAASIFLAPSAFAAPAVAPAEGDETTYTVEDTDWQVTGPESVVAGATFTLSGTDCFYRTDDSDGIPAGVVIATDAESDNPDEVLFEAEPDEVGTWSTEVFFPENTEAGEHTVLVSCLKSYNGTTEIREETYVDFMVTVTAPVTGQPISNPGAPTASPTASPTATTPAADFKPGATPNTPGTASVSTDKTTGAAAAPGQKVVKVIKGFKPFEKVTVVLHSAPVVLGVFTADAEGVVVVEFTVPAGTPLGNHTLAYDGDIGTHFEEPLQLTADGKALAYTGASIAMPLIGGSVLLAAGAGAMVVGRRRRSAGAAQA